MGDGAGKGRLFLDRSKLHDDLRLLGTALKRRWDISEDFRDTIVDRLRDIVSNGDDEIALKAIVQARNMEAQNQRDEHKQLDEFSQRIITLATRLGVDLTPLGIGDQASERAGRGDADTAQPQED